MRKRRWAEAHHSFSRGTVNSSKSQGGGWTETYETYYHTNIAVLCKGAVPHFLQCSDVPPTQLRDSGSEGISLGALYQCEEACKKGLEVYRAHASKLPCLVEAISVTGGFAWRLRECYHSS